MSRLAVKFRYQFFEPCQTSSCCLCIAAIVLKGYFSSFFSAQRIISMLRRFVSRVCVRLRGVMIPIRVFDCAHLKRLTLDLNAFLSVSLSAYKQQNQDDGSLSHKSAVS